MPPGSNLQSPKNRNMISSNASELIPFADRICHPSPYRPQSILRQGPQKGLSKAQLTILGQEDLQSYPEGAIITSKEVGRVRPHRGWRPKDEEQTPCCAFGEADPNAAQGCMCGMDSVKWSHATEEVVSQPYWGIVAWDCGCGAAPLSRNPDTRCGTTIPFDGAMFTLVPPRCYASGLDRFQRRRARVSASRASAWPWFSRAGGGRFPKRGVSRLRAQTCAAGD